ncbi:MAG: UvrD-helicase domain-containing protein [Spirochaetales bacterium]|nr:UvrD-helicase domain-containing protein [Spirochaetales bacterium]
MSKSIKIDSYQAEAIECLDNSIIMAGAGSGKTMVLSQRYLYLVVEKKVLPEEILTLTFTQKAASEMYQRIYQSLSQSTAQEAKRAAACFETASISTIDSFCGEIARSGSHEFGLPSQFQYANMKDFVRKESLEKLIEAYENPVINALVLQFGFDRIWENFLEKLCSDHFYLTSHLNFKATFSRQLEELKIHITKISKEWHQARDSILALEGDQKSLVNNQEQLKSLKISLHIENNAFSEASHSLKALNLKQPGNVKAENLLIMKEIIPHLRDLSSQLAQSLDYLAKESDLMGLAEWLQNFYEQYLHQKRNHLQTDFTDIAYLARDILLRDKDIRNYYKNKFKYIMIDEFQDNNSLQKDLLYLIAEKKHTFSKQIPKAEDLEPNKLYFVGDEKQSIYRFRKADVSVFKGLKDELTQSGGKALNLLYNYRSEPGLIHFFNQLFPSVLGKGEKPFEAEYKSLNPRSNDGMLMPEIHFLYKAYDNEESQSDYKNTEIEAYNLARYIAEIIAEKKLMVRQEGGVRPAEFSDIALLLRSTSNQNIYERMFRLFQIPYFTDNIRSLFLEAPLYDFYNIIKLAADPGDMLAYASYLHSPFVNLKDESLIKMMQRSEQLFYVPENLSPGEVKKIQLGRQLHESIRSMIDVCPLSDLVNHLWYNGGYRYFILSQPENHHYLEFFDYILAMARNADKEEKALAQFLKQIQNNLGQFMKQEDLKVLKAENQGLAILSVHRSKGLEFPIVMVADMGNKGSNTSEANAPFYFHKDYGITINWGEGNYFYQQAEALQKEEEEAEIKRLFYVALTRAESHLILSGIHHRGNQNSQNVFLNLFRQALEVQKENFKESKDFILIEKEIGGIEGIPFSGNSGQKKSDTIARIDRLYKKASIIRKKYRPYEISVTALTEFYDHSTALNKAEELNPYPVDQFLSDKADHAAFGTLVHYFISRQLLHPNWPLEWLPEVRSLFTKSQETQVFAQAREFSTMAIECGLKQHIASACKWKSEFPFLYRFDQEPQVLFKGIIDFLALYKDKVVIIDFKSDCFYKKEAYLPQLTIYSQAAGAIFSKPVEVYLLPIRAKRLDLVTQRLTDGEISGLIESYYAADEKNKKDPV